MPATLYPTVDTEDIKKLISALKQGNAVIRVNFRHFLSYNDASEGDVRKNPDSTYIQLPDKAIDYKEEYEPYQLIYVMKIVKPAEFQIDFFFIDSESKPATTNQEITVRGGAHETIIQFNEIESILRAKGSQRVKNLQNLLNKILPKVSSEPATASKNTSNDIGGTKETTEDNDDTEEEEGGGEEDTGPTVEFYTMIEMEYSVDQTETVMPAPAGSKASTA